MNMSKEHFVCEQGEKNMQWSSKSDKHLIVLNVDGWFPMVPKEYVWVCISFLPLLLMI